MARDSTSSFNLKKFWSAVPSDSYNSLLKIYLQLYLVGLKNMLSSPVTTILTIFTVMVSMLLLSVFILGLENIRQLLLDRGDSLSVSLYLKDGVSEEQVKLVKEEVLSVAGVESVDYLSKEQALKNFSETLSEYQALISGYQGDNNPLPASLEVKFELNIDSEGKIRGFIEGIKKRSEVELVQVEESAIARLMSLLRAGRSASLLALVFVFIMTSAIVANTISLGLYSHRAEIEIMRLVGAPEWFVRAPFLVEGIIQGLIGALFSLSLARVIFGFLRDKIAENPLLNSVISQPSFVSLEAASLIVFIGMAVAGLGSFVAVKRMPEGTI